MRALTLAISRFFLKMHRTSIYVHEGFLWVTLSQAETTQIVPTWSGVLAEMSPRIMKTANLSDWRSTGLHSCWVFLTLQLFASRRKL